VVLVINDNPYGLMFALRYIFEGMLHRQCMKNIVHQHKYIHCGLVMNDDSNKQWHHVSMNGCHMDNAKMNG